MSKTGKRATPPRRNAAGGRVTALAPQAKHPDRFNLFVDGHFALGLSAYVAAQVRVGQELTPDQLEALARAEQVEDAHARALRHLEARPHSEQEIRRFLADRELADEVVDQVVARLRRAHLLSDREFAKFWVENREAFRPRSARALTYELRRKGVPRAEIAQAVGQVDERASAYRAARPRAERWKQLEAREFRAKLSGFLARRGFDYEVTRETVSKIWNEFRGQEAEDSEEMD
jgi:regulatory protein